MNEWLTIIIPASIWVAPEKYISLEEQGLPPAPNIDESGPETSVKEEPEVCYLL